jgi:RluA family pseudouridine synthase
VHRLDRDTSGVLVYARTADARRSLAQQFRRRTVEKTYLALVRGAVERDLEIDLPIRTLDGRTRAAVERGNHADAKPALTRVHVRERFGGHTLVECRPKTGRLHQIRVHLAAMGFPLAVDPVYGSGEGLWLSALKADYRRSRSHEERPLIGRLTLHAASLAIDHPVHGERLTFTADLPKDFRAAITQLRRLAR